MKDVDRKLIALLTVCVIIGAIVDFGFNGVAIGFLFHRPFQETWSFIYIPFFFAVAMMLSTYLVRGPYRDVNLYGVLAFFIGTALGHFALVGFGYTRHYLMKLDVQYDAGQQTFLLRSPEWSQILFVTSDRAKQELSAHFLNTPVPVDMAVMSDYGCDRSAVVRTVAGVDVQTDNGATWTWQVDHTSPSSARYEPGNEDQRFFWCYHAKPIKDWEGGPVGVRPWEVHSTGQELHPQ